ncbi:HAD family hydrolase [Aneurinibacillus migulanus]|nr:HAD family hydrolase [Aneurinibacillus migulanus]
MISLYSCIVFDVDGTIIDTEKAVLSSLQKVLKIETGRNYTFDELSFALGIPGTVALERLNVTHIEQVNKRWNEYLKEFFHYVRVFPGLEETIKELHSLGITTGIVTSKTKTELINDFYPFGLNDYLPYTICADDTEKHKPNPEPLLKFLKIAEVSPSEVLYIGDTYYDMQCAQSANIDFALALWGAKKVERFQPTYQFESPKEIFEVVNR